MEQSNDDYVQIAMDEAAGAANQPAAEVEKQEIDISNGGTAMWLVKVPAFLMQEWQQAPEGTELGTIEIEHMQSTTAPNVAIKLTNQNSDMPKNYQVRQIGKPESMFAFTEDTSEEAEGRAQAICGSVQFEFHATPVIDEDYRRIMKRRRDQADSANRHTRPLDSSSAAAGGEMGGDQSANNVSKKFLENVSIPSSASLLVKKKRKAEDFRRDRMPREELVELLFKAFAKREHYSFKDIQEVVNQPVAYLKEIMAELCIFISRGPYKGMYQLKPEYKQLSASNDTTEKKE